MAVGNLEFIKSASGSSVTTLDVTNCFTSKYDVYVFSIDKVDAQAGGYFNLRFLDSGGTVISASEYDFASLNMNANTSFSEGKYTSGSLWNNVFGKDDGVEGSSASIYISNPYDSSSYTFMQSQASGDNGTALVGFKSIGVHKVAETIRGFQLLETATRPFDEGKISVYGVK